MRERTTNEGPDQATRSLAGRNRKADAGPNLSKKRGPSFCARTDALFQTDAQNRKRGLSRDVFLQTAVMHACDFASHVAPRLPQKMPAPKPSAGGGGVADIVSLVVVVAAMVGIVWGGGGCCGSGG